MNNKFYFLVLILVGFGALAFLASRYVRDDFKLPKGGETKNEIITLADGEERKIMVTDGVKHSIPLEEIISGGPPKDGIPSIDRPRFHSIAEADAWLDDGEPGVAFSRGNTHRFYPYQILVWHEIVNDTIPQTSSGQGSGERILVTYCPLCLTGFVFDPLVRGERVEFGTSGKLWKSNLVMYDRKTESLWPQILGEAVVGEVTGAKLPTLPSDQMRYGDWKKAAQGASGGQYEVLSRATGAERFYGTNPYDDYFSVSNFSLQLVNAIDARLPNDAFVFGIVVGGKAKAYDVEAVKTKGEVMDTFRGQKFILRHDAELDVVRIFKILQDGTEERINPFSSFWFSWAAVHPDTELYN